MLLIKNCNVIFPEGIEKKNVLVENSKIKEITNSDKYLCDTLEGEGLYLSPGFIDVHIHGSGGYDVMDGRYESIDKISEIIADFGTTSFVPTTMTFDSKKIKTAVKIVSEAKKKGTSGANVLGCHLEGPFINREAIGAHDINCVLDGSVENFKEIIGESERDIVSVTLAPEVGNNKELIKYLYKKGIVASIGHSKASYEEAVEAINLGISHSTHIFNAMPIFHHRNPGIIGAIFDNNITTEIIADGIINSYTALRVVCNQKKVDDIIIVTDAIMYSNMDDGKYLINNEELNISNSKAELKSGVLAGSITMLNKAVKNVYNNTNCSLHEVIKMVTINPAKHCKVDNSKGSIMQGFDADIIIFDGELNIKNVIVNGRMIRHK
ncbi:N-acetylglucosamine-6-phosphate deacetylase [Inconstantimicrobium mannanitabidum]|uniref:N-acetylglucosamine-6-phosphate deacetylase n=1 Tax=Inconstantimicrobium mannanitabidum TaxID=1604901 RepID=A0ACB5R7X3_9CLOT|nr:N-acetylglucosamine-6-phosphate deacetylase [Clostridium sp. TW13]GKX65200.1 N-acetylglucosamine-6-phosphate deacetylase [Clostridium sp. TW13]